MTSSTDERNPDEYIEQVSTGVTRESFEKAFRSFGPVQHLLPLIDKNAMDILFEIADHYLHHYFGVRAMDKRLLCQDYGTWEKLLSGTDSRLEELQNFMQSFIRSGRPRTSSRARAMLKETRAFHRKLDNRFLGEEFRIRGWQFLLSVLNGKTAVYEYTPDLEAFIKGEFSKLHREDKDVLIAAAMAGARMYTAAERADPCVVNRIPMQVSRAKRHYKRYYSDPDVGRVSSYLNAKRKVKKKQGQDKTQK
jgi:hypothetical protein